MVLFKLCFEMNTHTESKRPQTHQGRSELQLCTGVLDAAGLARH